MIDTAQVLYTFLANSPELAGIPIYGPPGLPQGYAGGKTVVFWVDGGDQDIYLPRAAERFQVRCYGATAQEARHVYGHLVDALHRAHGDVIAGGDRYRILYARQDVGPYDMVERDFGWPFVQAWYIVEVYRTTV